MKLFIVLVLLFFSEVYCAKLRLEDARARKRFTKSMVLVKPQNPLVQAFEQKFLAFGTNLENSKFFNFLAGAAIKSFSLLEGNAIGEILKCSVTGIETFYNAMKFPAKTASELKEMAKGLDDKAAGSALTEAETNDGTEDAEVQNELAEGQKETHEIDCHSTSEIMKKKDGIDFIDDVGTEEQMDTPKFSQTKLPKLFKKIKAKFQSLKNKFGKLMEKFKEKLTKIETTLKRWLGKPIVKAVIAFLECSLPNILTIIVKGGMGFASMFTGLSLINVVKQGPKFLKMIIDGIKSIRNGFTKDKIKEKFMEYGKGTASIIIAVILGAAGS